MRKIEMDIINALECERYFKHGNIESTPHDEVSYGIARLIGTIYAVKKDNILILGIYDGAWQTTTTKSRINAICQYYGLPKIYPKKHKWLWSDGIPYTGQRIFTLEAMK